MYFVFYSNNFCTGMALCNRNLFDALGVLKVQILSNTINITTLYKFIMEKRNYDDPSGIIQ